MDFSIQMTYADAGTCVVALSGDFDIYSSPTFKREAAKIGKRMRVIVNIEQVRYLDHAGLSALITLLRAQRNSGGDVSLVCTNPQLRKTFNITGLCKVFGIFPSDDKALAA